MTMDPDHEDMMNMAEDKMSEAQGYLRCIVEELQEQHQALENMDEHERNHQSDLIESVYERIGALDAIDDLIYSVINTLSRTRDAMKKED